MATARRGTPAIGQALQTYSCFSFRDGLDVKSSVIELGTKKVTRALTKASNVVYTSAGAVTKRYDQDKYNTVSLGATVAITGGIQFRHSNGTDYLLVGTDDGRLVKLNSDGTTTNIKTGLTTGTQWSMAVYNDKVISCNRKDVPRKWDGTTDAVLGGTPPATGGPVVAHSNRVFMLDGTATSTLYWCALNNEEDWTTASNAGNVQVNPNDSQMLTSLVSTTKSELVLCKPNNVYRLQGTAPSTYTITNVLPALASSGCVAQAGLVYAMMDTWMLGPDGVHTLTTVQAFGDLKEAFASKPLDPYFTPNTAYTLSLQNLTKAVSVYHRQASTVMWAVDSDSDGKNDTLLLYNLYTKGWSVWPNQSIASLWIVRNATTGLEEVFAGGYDGFVRVLNRKSSTNAYTGEAKHLSALGTPGLEKTPRHLFLHFAEQGNINVTVTLTYDFGKGGGQTYTVSLLGNSHTIGVNWVLGVDPLGRQSQLIKRIDLSGLAEFVEISVKNANAGETFTWYGYELQYRPRRLIRRGG